jgi:high-affinity iron transporter
VHLLDYVAVDYPVAVVDGRVVNELEYREQLEFADQVGRQLEGLGLAAGDPLLTALARLRAAIEGRAPAEPVAGGAGRLAAAIRERFGLRALPSRLPGLERGRRLYAEACASCHGDSGRGDGPAAAALDPRPSDFADRGRMLALSPLALFHTISFGIEGTAMAGFGDRFAEADRYALALYVGAFPFRPQEVARGRLLVEAAAPVRVPTSAALLETPARDLARDADELAVVAFLRAHPEALRHGELPLAVARRQLEASFEAYRAGERERAFDLALSAYLDGFEPIEPALEALDPSLRASLEAGFARYRAQVREAGPSEVLEAELVSLREGLATARARLERGDLGPTALFVASLAILSREGLEALLVVVALLAVLARSGRPEAARYVHLGWLAALGAGALTWLAARSLVRLSGAGREVIEGVSSLLAMALLFYVSFWLVSRLEATRWQAFLGQRLRSALAGRSLLALAGVAFVAVYREAFETVLFYQALVAQAGPAGLRSVGLGIGAGVACLLVLATAILRLGRRLPLRAFFGSSSVLLYALAVVLAGHGVASLQEAGWLTATWLPAPRVEWLGLYPSAEGLALQALLLAAALGGLLFALAPGRTAPQRVR